MSNLARSFFGAVDQALETTDYSSFYSGRASRAALINSMASVVVNQQIGLAIVDEIQVLCKTRGVWVDQLLNFLVQLRNVVGLPVVLIGTPEAVPILTSKLRQARRGTGQGEHRWERLAKDHWWDELVQTMWQYQYTRQCTPFEARFSDVLYEESQGIPDIAVKLFRLAQKRAIMRQENDERLSEELLRMVAKERLGGCQGVLQGIRSGDLSQLGPSPDVFLVTENTEQAVGARSRSPGKDDPALRFHLWLRAAGFQGRAALRLANAAVEELGRQVDQLSLIRWAVEKDRADRETNQPDVSQVKPKARQPQKPQNHKAEGDPKRDPLRGHSGAKKRGVIRRPEDD